jgi:flagellar assembly factor FliW
VAFIVVNPFIMFPDYSVNIGDEDQLFLDLKEPKDSLILTILTVVNNNITANLKAPLVMNTVTLKAAQIILDDERYAFRTPLPSVPPQASNVERQASQEVT